MLNFKALNKVPCGVGGDGSNSGESDVHLY
jgi:hypothetical protein